MSPARAVESGQGSATREATPVSVLVHPLAVGPTPLLWRDGSRREHRRACQHLVRDQRVEVNLPPSPAKRPIPPNVMLSRTQRAHTRLSWETRLARNARGTTGGHIIINLFGVSDDCAALIGLAHV